MRRARKDTRRTVGLLVGISIMLAVPTAAQLVDRTSAPNAAGAGIAKSLADQVGAGRGVTIVGSVSR